MLKLLSAIKVRQKTSLYFRGYVQGNPWRIGIWRPSSKLTIKLTRICVVIIQTAASKLVENVYALFV